MVVIEGGGIDYQEGSRLLKRTLDRAVANEGLTFTEALDAHTRALEGVLREAVAMRRAEQARAEAVDWCTRCVVADHTANVCPQADEAEQAITALLAPKTEAQAEARRRERDRADAEVLKDILARNHDSALIDLSEDDRRVLASVAHRLLKDWVAE